LVISTRSGLTPRRTGGLSVAEWLELSVRGYVKDFKIKQRGCDLSVKYCEFYLNNVPPQNEIKINNFMQEPNKRFTSFVLWRSVDRRFGKRKYCLQLYAIKAYITALVLNLRTRLMWQASLADCITAANKSQVPWIWEGVWFLGQEHNFYFLAVKKPYIFKPITQELYSLGQCFSTFLRSRDPD
jgi:hypothetical protein